MAVKRPVYGKVTSRPVAINQPKRRRQLGTGTTNPGAAYKPPYKLAQPAAANAAAAQAAIAKVAAPQVKMATLAPFQTPTDIANEADARLRFESGTADIDSALENQRIEGEHAKGQIKKSATQATADTQWDMGARGLGQSSIRDGALYDIDATAALRRDFIDQQLRTATLQGQSTKQRLSTWWTSFQDAMKKQMVENAAAVPQSAPPAEAPAPAAAPGGGGTHPASQTTNPGVGTRPPNWAPWVGRPQRDGKYQRADGVWIPIKRGTGTSH